MDRVRRHAAGEHPRLGHRGAASMSGGKRIARATGTTRAGPSRTIGTTIGGGVTPPPVGGSFTDGYDLFGLEGIQSFSPASPTLKNGAPITGDMLTYHNAVTGWLLNPNKNPVNDLIGVWSAPATPSNSDSWLNSKARVGQIVMETVFRVFRLTGDLRILDYLCTAANGLASTEVTEWSQPRWTDLEASSTYSVCDGASGPNFPWSPYPKHLTFQSLNATYGADITRTEYTKWLHVLAKLAWVLWVNRNKTSPGGYNYATLAAFWAGRVEMMAKAWSETTGACWAQNYKGVQNAPGSGIDNVSNSTNLRQGWGKYPILLVDGAHTPMDAILGNRYLGLLGQTGAANLLNPADALVAAQQVAHAKRVRLVPCTDTDYGAKLVLRRNYGLSDKNLEPGKDLQPQNMTYVANHGGAFLDLWLTGAHRSTFTMSDMYQIGRAVAWGHYDFGVNPGRLYKNMTRDVLVCGFESFESTSEQSATVNARRGHASLGIVFDPGGTKMSSIGTYLQNVAGGYTSPESAPIAAAQFMRAALLAVGDIEAGI
jgi:hypothetical protein